jgi:opacity protein-like surface antigen
MKTIVRISLAAVAVAVFANAASAQLPTMPVYTAPGGYQGLMISGDWGMGMNDDAKSYGSSDSPMAFGGAVGYGAKMFNITALVGYLDHKNAALSKPISFGGNVGVTVLQKAESPLAINVFGGVGYTSLSLEGGGSVGTNLNVPFGVGIGFAPPSSGSVSFQVWGAPRGNWTQFSPEVGESTSRFGFGAAGGVNVNFAQGFGIHAAIDWTSFSEDTDAGLASASPMVVGAGLHYLFKMPGSGSGM